MKAVELSGRSAAPDPGDGARRSLRHVLSEDRVRGRPSTRGDGQCLGADTAPSGVPLIGASTLPQLEFALSATEMALAKDVPAEGRAGGG